MHLGGKILWGIFKSLLLPAHYDPRLVILITSDFKSITDFLFKHLNRS